MTGDRLSGSPDGSLFSFVTPLERNLFAIDANLAQRKTRPYTEFWSIFFGFPKGRKKLILQGEKGPYIWAFSPWKIKKCRLYRDFSTRQENVFGGYYRVFNLVRLCILFDKNLMIQAVVVELA